MNIEVRVNTSSFNIPCSSVHDYSEAHHLFKLHRLPSTNLNFFAAF